MCKSGGVSTSHSPNLGFQLEKAPHKFFRKIVEIRSKRIDINKTDNSVTHTAQHLFKTIIPAQTLTSVRNKAIATCWHSFFLV